MNTVLIKEVNNTPYIFNVDNAVDAARLEALQAVKMAEDMVTSVFGEQSNFADNTTCLVTLNSDNPAFPYKVAFDASKIIESPKRNCGNLSTMAMPSNKYIDLVLGVSGSTYKAPADGYYTVIKHMGSNDVKYISISCIENGISIEYKAPYPGSLGRLFLPVKKGQTMRVRYDATGMTQLFRFIYAEGEI